MDIDRLIADKRILITVGSGGVGKTTCAAALAVRAAQSGRKVAVLTVDPARRLAASLGIAQLADEASQVAIPTDDGRTVTMDAMMLDTHSTLERLVRRYAADAEQADSILQNRFFNQFSGAVGGTHEYSAMERLFELNEQGGWDLLILDTPPSGHALDFLDAPQRLIDAFDESIFKWVIKPGLTAGKVLSFGSSYIFKILAQITGGEMIKNLSEFLTLFRGMFAGFRERARAVQQMLADPRTGFLIVTTPQPGALSQGRVFYRELKKKGLTFNGFILNRSLTPLDVPARAEAVQETFKAAKADAAVLKTAGLAKRLATALARHNRQADAQQATMRAFAKDLDQTVDFFAIPLQDTDVSDINGLMRLANTLVKRSDL